MGGTGRHAEADVTARGAAVHRTRPALHRIWPTVHRRGTGCHWHRPGCHAHWPRRPACGIGGPPTIVAFLRCWPPLLPFRPAFHRSRTGVPAHRGPRPGRRIAKRTRREQQHRLRGRRHRVREGCHRVQHGRHRLRASRHRGRERVHRNRLSVLESGQGVPPVGQSVPAPGQVEHLVRRRRSIAEVPWRQYDAQDHTVRNAGRRAVAHISPRQSGAGGSPGAGRRVSLRDLPEGLVGRPGRPPRTKGVSPWKP